jgi:hypothetical protein
MREDPRYSYEWRCKRTGRTIARLVKHGNDVYIETEGNHDGTVVFTTVEIPRVEFAAGIRHIGGLL